MNNLALTVALATAPSTAFAELRERRRFWFPLLLVVLTTAGLTYWYYSIVDIEWLKDAMFGNNPKFQQMDEDKRAAAMAMFGRGPLLWSSVISMFIFIPAVLLLEGLYLLVAAKVTKLSLGFKHWFSLACWTSLPMLLTTVVGAILLILADNSQVAQYSVMAPLSLNELLLHVPAGGPGYSLFESLSIPFFLSCALMIIGVHNWSQRSWGFSAIVVLLPWVLIYGIAAFFSFR
jgi:magnesium-transporting ATPase (P-type)